MSNVLNFIWEYRFLILWVLGVIAYCASMGFQWMKTKAVQLMLLAKDKAKDQILNSGQAQEDWVVDELYIVLSRLKIPFITKENLRPFVKQLYNLTKEYLKDK